MEAKCIVIAWALDSAEWDGKAWAADLGHRPRMVAKREARAAVWLLRGTDADVEKARAHCAECPADGRRVFVYPVDEPDPLGRAKRDVLRAR